MQRALGISTAKYSTSFAFPKQYVRVFTAIAQTFFKAQTSDEHELTSYLLFAQNLIGKDGATINRLRETYSCEISFDDKEEKVKVSGDDQIYNCVKEIMKIPIECEKREVCFLKIWKQ